jgi:two-component system LytT family sensor kinase
VIIDAFHAAAQVAAQVGAQVAARTPAPWSIQDRVSIVVRPLIGLALVLVIHAIARRNPWPRPFRLRFVALHAVLAPAMVVAWIVLSRLVEAVFLGWGATVPYEQEFFLVGTIAYLIAGGISYSVESTARAAQAESVAARTQLAALRSQLHPHFLFNALHTVVQLIPANPTLAMEAAEIVAELLRSSLEEQRDEVPLADEWRFVSRYLAVERIRFGERLVVREELPPTSLTAQVPAFALQTLVENAVRHGAAPRAAATEIVVSASASSSSLTLMVRNTSGGVPRAAAAGAAGGAVVVSPSSTAITASTGTGLARLRERLAALYGNSATLTSGPIDGGYEATLVIPQGSRGATA